MHVRKRVGPALGWHKAKVKEGLGRLSFPCGSRDSPPGRKVID